MAELTTDDVRKIWESFNYRKSRFPHEQEFTAFALVLMNWGDSLTVVYCTSCGWRGTKGDLPRAQSLPKCPEGHPLMEYGPLHRLGLIQVKR